MKKRLQVLVIVLLIGVNSLLAQNQLIKDKSSVEVNYETFQVSKKVLSNNEPKVQNQMSISDGEVSISRGITSEAGSTTGGLSVSLMGAVNYSVPVMVPSGIKDISPNIAVSYSSQGSNGLAGWGWNISGLSTISRVSSTKYYDNEYDGVDFKDDRLSLDGQRLILKSGTYGASGSVYQTENYSNTKVVAYGTSPYGNTYGPSYFVIFYPNGTRVWYGNSGGARSRLEWAIFRWQDPQGNYADYNYQSDNGMLSIKTIKFGGRIGGTTPMNQINFTYVERTRPENVYVGDFHFKRTNLLKSIQVISNNSQYRKYELSYNTTSLGYERLASIKEYNSKNKSFSPIQFNYDNTDAGFKNRIVSGDLYPGFNYKTSNLIAGEFNGDGRTDVVFYDKTKKNDIYLHDGLFNQDINVAYKINTGGFTNIFPSTILTSNGKVLGQQAITTIKETTSTGSSTSAVRFRTFAKAPSGIYHQYDKIWNAQNYNSDNTCNNTTNYYSIPKEYVSGDFNGDGLTDVIAIEKRYTSTNCSKGPCDVNDGIGILKEKEQSNSELAKKTKVNKFPINECCNCSSTSNSGRKVHFIDLNRQKTSNFSNISGYFRREIGSKDRILTGDHNGDGRQDIYHFQEGNIYIYTFDHNTDLKLVHHEVDTNIKLDYPALLGDYNGDGKTDFLIPTANNSSNWKYFISKGKNYYKEVKSLPFNYSIDHITDNAIVKEFRYSSQDINGDGKTDIIFHSLLNDYVKKNNIVPTAIELLRVYKSDQNVSSICPTFSLESITGNYTDYSIEKKFGTPIFLESNKANGNLEYAYISANNIFAYESTKDSRRDMLLKSVVNNGITSTIDYDRVGNFDEDISTPSFLSAYTPGSSQTYPYINIDNSPSFHIVRKLTEEGAGIKRYQDFRYHGAVSNVNLGFVGFLKTKRTNWYGDGVGTLWTISKHDPTKRGAITEQWVSTSSYEGGNYISKTTNTFNTNLSSNKIFINLITQIEQHNTLQGITRTKSFTYDSYKNPLTESTIYNGGNENINYTYSNNPSVNNQYYHIGRLTKQVETNTIGGNAFTTEEQYIYSNNLLTEQKVKGNGTSWNTESFVYDAFGNVIRKTLTPNGLSSRVENFKYDTSGRFITESTDIEGLKTKFTYDIFGNPLTTTNPYNQITTFTYDGWTRLASEKNYLGKTTIFSYSRISGNGVRKTIDYPQGADEIEEYNALGWIIKSGVLGINNKWTYKSIQYDVGERVIKESEPYFSAPNQWNTTAYDDYGRAVGRTSFNGLIVNISYNGLVTTVDDGTKIIKTTKDGNNNIIKMEDPGGVINYAYYGNGVMKTANYGSHVVKTEIDGWGRKIKLIDPSAGIYSYKYDDIGELLEETTPKGSTIYTYDVYGKVMSKIINGEETNMSLSYTYNSTTKLLTSIQGNNTRTNENYTYTYTYDSQKRPYITKEQNGKAYFEHRVSRDSYGRVNTETYISKNSSNNVISTVKISNIYENNSGILTEIKEYAPFSSSNSLWKINEVNERGQAEKVTLGNGIIKRRSYDQYGFLTKILDKANEKSGAIALDLDYSFNSIRGNLNSRSNNNLDWDETFTYDNLDRLTNVSGSVSRKQEYDNRGRISSNSEIGMYNYGNATSYRLQDVNLNTKGDLYYQNNPIQKIKYNAYKKPVSISVKDKAKVDFEYGILQNRSHSYYGGNEENKLDRRYQKHYSAISPVEIEVDKNGNTKIITYIGGDAYSAPVVHIKQTDSGSTNGYHYLHRDYLSSILAISDSTGKLKEQRQFGAWGEVNKFKVNHYTELSLINGTRATSTTNEIDFDDSTTLISRGYTGHEHFMGISLIHMNGRMYDAKLGRFLSPDNYIQEPYSTQSFNRYGYVWNNPLKFTDQSGEFIITAIIIGAVVGAYFGGVQANGSWNPLKWNWGSSETWGGIFGGAIIGGISGGAGAVAAGVLTPLITSAGGFIGGAVGGSISGGLMSGLPGGDGDFWGGAFRGTIMGAALGGVLGGAIGGIKTLFSKTPTSFWTGKDIAPKVISPKPIAKTVSSLKANSVNDVAPKNSLANQKLDLKTPTSNNKSVTGSYKKIGLDGRKSFNLRIEPLRIGRSVEASWGKHFNYRHGGSMSAVEHINYRHAFNTGFENVSKFSQGTSVNMIKDYVSQALKYGTPIKGGFEYTFGNVIGTNTQGGAAFSIRVFVRDGWVRTAFPF